MSKLSSEQQNSQFMSEIVMALRENTNVLQQNIKETRKLSELLGPNLKKSEAVKMKQLESKHLLDDCLRTIQGGK
ncbi:MAG: hypothetical protein HOE64_17115 [Nitrospina sp.]|nr:hypothetical protein [Nitrospina sp.]